MQSFIFVETMNGTTEPAFCCTPKHHPASTEDVTEKIDTAATDGENLLVFLDFKTDASEVFVSERRQLLQAGLGIRTGNDRDHIIKIAEIALDVKTLLDGMIEFGQQEICKQGRQRISNRNPRIMRFDDAKKKPDGTSIFQNGFDSATKRTMLNN